MISFRIRKRATHYGALLLLAAGVGVGAVSPDQPGAGTVVRIDLDEMIQPVSAEYALRGIEHANEIQAEAVLIVLSTPGGLEKSLREIVKGMVDSQVPVIVYVSPSGSRAASAGFFLLIAADVAVMAPGTNTGAAHPVLMGGRQIGKTMEEKIRNDAAAYIRSLAAKRGRNVELAEKGVRESRSYTEKEALEGNLINAVATSTQEIFRNFDGKTIRRFNDETVVLQLAGVKVDPYPMTRRERFLSNIIEPNIAFLLAALGVIGLYVEFTNPGLIVPGVAGAISLVLSLFAFNFLPINWTGVLLLFLAVVLFVLEAQIASHGILAAGGVLSMVIGSLILVDSPWPEARIHLSTALGVAIPLGIITVILLRAAITAHRRKAMTGDAQMLDATGTAQSDLDLTGTVFIRGELWSARSEEKISQDTRVRVKSMEGLILVVEPIADSRLPIESPSGGETK
jgi:membrane-bound serine protease (ClpP class)